jgi:hypothetical protein
MEGASIDNFRRTVLTVSGDPVVESACGDITQDEDSGSLDGH